MQSSIKLLMAQINPIVGAIEANKEKIIAIIKENQTNYDVIAFPELVLTGYPPEDLLLRTDFHREVQKALAEIQKNVQVCQVIVGHPTHIDNQLFNSASVFLNQQQIHCYHKQALPNYGVFDELRYFTKGPKEDCILVVNNKRIGLCICEDIWQDEIVQKIQQKNIEGLICINASPFDYNKLQRRMDLLQNYAKKDLAIFYVNLVGGQDELIFDGQSLAFDNKGHLKVKAKAFEEDLVNVEWNNTHIQGKLRPFLNHEEQIYKALVLGTKDYVEKNGFPGVLLGLSGGIDSALTLAIACDALGADKVHAVMMPSRYSADISLHDAQKQIKSLNVESSLIPIESVFTSILDELNPFFLGYKVDSTEENIQARIRGLFLMALSNKTGKMVLTTSNKSETAVGYATLYGDMAGGFAVLKDVLKTEVYALAKYRNSLNPIIPERVITRAPSAELAPNQTDQDSLPDYAILDGIIKGYMEQDLSFDDLLAKGYSEKDLNLVIRLIKRNEYKRQQAAPGIKVSERAFGKDWRYPITNQF